MKSATRYSLLLLALACLPAFSIAQTTDPGPKTDSTRVYVMFDIQQPPQFPGGEKALMEYLTRQIRYPAEARANGVQGIVAVVFVVGRNGAISDVKVVKRVSKEIDEEAVRVVEGMPNWEPGRLHDEPVAVRYTLPIRFKL